MALDSLRQNGRSVFLFAITFILGLILGITLSPGILPRLSCRVVEQEQRYDISVLETNETKSTLVSEQFKLKIGNIYMCIHYIY